MLAERLNVGQFIEKLQAYPQDALVVVAGANYDFDPASIELRDVDRQSDGKLTEDWYPLEDDVPKEKVKVVVVE